MKISIIIVLLFFVGGISYSCTPDDHLNKDLVKGKDIIHPGRIVNSVFFSGYNRMAINVQLPRDPKLNKLIMYWNNKADSTVLEIKKSDFGLEKQVMINNLLEGTYLIELFTQNTENIRSIQTNLPGKVYGASYVASLPKRIFDSGGFDKGRAWIEWVPETKTGFVTTRVEYTNMEGGAVVIDVPVVDDWIYIDGYKPGTLVYFSGGYKPDSRSLDTCYSEKNSIIIK